MTRSLLFIVFLQIFAAHQAPATPPSDEGEGEKPRWAGVLRAGYSTWSNASAGSGSWSASGGLYFQIMSWLAVGPDGGYQNWNTQRSESGRTPVHAAWNVSVAFALNDFGLYRRWRLEPQAVLALGIYGRRFHDVIGEAADRQQIGPGLSLGLGLRYLPRGLRPGSGVNVGFGIMGRRHIVMMDDYGVAFAGPEHEWTKTWEVAAEVLVGWE